MAKKKLQERLRILKQEIVMGAYYDGWTLKGLKEEYRQKKARLVDFKRKHK